MKIILASDHAGYNLKEYLKTRLCNQGLDVEDLGTHSDQHTSYVYYTLCAVRHLVDHPADKAIFACGNGIAMALLANRFPGMRAAVCHDPFTARTAREMVNANIISFGERIVGLELAWDLTSIYLADEYRGEKDQRYAERLAQIEAVEAGLYHSQWLHQLDQYLWINRSNFA